jgi:hypothetical protein
MGTSALKSTQITNLDATPIVTVNTRGINGRAAAVRRRLCHGGCLGRGRLDLQDGPRSLERHRQAAHARQRSAGCGQDQPVGLLLRQHGRRHCGLPILASSSRRRAISSLRPTLTSRRPSRRPTSPTRVRTTPWRQAHKHLWDALGLTSDPGGFFDIVAVVHTTAITTGTGKIYLACEYVG